ncbi:MAG: dephospho-CoA kinase/protein folding accessory protein, partial [Pedosphaera sp.]|nr:dephospho-CoA kinase/protein folding accessory protein [Pedosphaera sp.]
MSFVAVFDGQELQGVVVNKIMSNSSQKIIVENYNPEWVNHFEKIKKTIWKEVSDVAVSIEHVGSTSVVGLPAKPVIDIDIVISSLQELPGVIERLQKLGYKHRGNLGIEGRDAFYAPQGTIKHNLYVCLQGGLALKNHLLLRERLRKDPVARFQYGELKKSLALKFSDSIEEYIEG